MQNKKKSGATLQIRFPLLLEIIILKTLTVETLLLGGAYKERDSIREKGKHGDGGSREWKGSNTSSVKTTTKKKPNTRNQRDKQIKWEGDLEPREIGLGGPRRPRKHKFWEISELFDWTITRNGGPRESWHDSSSRHPSGRRRAGGHGAQGRLGRC